VLFFAVYNWQTTGDPFLTGYQMEFGAKVAPGFHEGNELNLPQAVNNLVSHLRHYAIWAPASAVGLFAPRIWTLLFARIRWRERLLLSQWFLVWLFYFFYRWYNLALGPRFHYETIAPYSLLAAGGLLSAVERFRQWLADRKIDPPDLRRSVNWIVAALCLATAATVVERKRVFRQENEPPLRFCESVIEQCDDPRDVLFVGAGQFFNALTVQTASHPDGPLYIEHMGDEWNRQFMEAHPDRQYYFGTREGIWPYDETPREILEDPKRVAFHIKALSREEIEARFHNPGGRPLRPAAAE